MGLGSVAQAESKGQAGILDCKIIPGSGYTVLIHSSSKANCVFRTPDGRERYRASMGIGLGIDLSWMEMRRIRFAVVGISGKPRVGAHSLAGKYMGGNASVAVGLGLGASALIGGGENGFALQPLGIEQSEGFGVAAGLGYLFLEPG